MTGKRETEHSGSTRVFQLVGTRTTTRLCEIGKKAKYLRAKRGHAGKSVWKKRGHEKES